jgi:hypothetical protein
MTLKWEELRQDLTGLPDTTSSSTVHYPLYGRRSPAVGWFFSPESPYTSGSPGPGGYGPRSYRRQERS